MLFLYELCGPDLAFNANLTRIAFLGVSVSACFFPAFFHPFVVVVGLELPLCSLSFLSSGLPLLLLFSERIASPEHVPSFPLFLAFFCCCCCDVHCYFQHFCFYPTSPSRFFSSPFTISSSLGEFTLFSSFSFAFANEANMVRGQWYYHVRFSFNGKTYTQTNKNRATERDPNLGSNILGYVLMSYNQATLVLFIGDTSTYRSLQSRLDLRDLFWPWSR